MKLTHVFSLAGLLLFSIHPAELKAATFANVATLRAAGTPPAVKETQATAGYYVSGDGGGAIFQWNAALTAADNGGSIIQPAAITGVAPGRWVSTEPRDIADLRKWGVKADGVTDDAPPVAHALEWLSTAPGVAKQLIFPAGTLAILSAQAPSTYSFLCWNCYPDWTSYTGTTSVWSLASLTGTLTITGAGKAQTVLVMPTARTMWDGLRGDSKALEITFEGMTMKNTSPCAETIESYAMGVVASYSHIKSLTVRECAFHDFTVALLLPSHGSNDDGNPTFAEIDRAEFFYQYGAASAPQAAEDQSPRAAIYDAASTTKVHDCYFNGLVDPTFTGLPPGTVASQRVPMDNFIQTNDWGKYLEIKDNYVINHNVEGIHIGFDAPGVVSETIVTNNYVAGAEANYPAYFYGIRPGVKVNRYANVTIDSNTIKNEIFGVQIYGSGPTASVTNNTITESFGGIFVHAGNGTLVQGNHFSAVSNPAAGDVAAGLNSERAGVYLFAGTKDCIVDSNEIDGMSSTGWFATGTVSGSSRHPNTASRIYLDSVAGFEIDRWIVLIKQAPHNSILQSRVTNIGADYIEILPYSNPNPFVNWGNWGLSVQAGDVIRASGIGGEPMVSAGILVRGGTNGSNNRITNNTIRNHIRGVDRYYWSSGNSPADAQVSGNIFENVDQPFGDVQFLP